MTQYSDKEIQQEKDLLLEKLLDPGATLTDVELEKILADDELREIHEVSAAVRGASLLPSKIDVEQEWKLFRHKLHPKQSPWRWTMRVAAIFLGILFVSGIVRFALDRLLTDGKAVMVAESSVKRDSTQGSVPALHDQPAASPFEEEIDVSPKQVMVNPLSVRKKVSVETAEEDEEEVDIDEYLRLQQARIDNDLALLLAELYIEELQALDVTLPFEGEDTEPQPQEVKYVIMQ